MSCYGSKYIKSNGQVLHRSTYQALTQEEWVQKECKAEYSLFMESPCQRLGSQAMVRDSVELGTEDMLQYDPYDDESQNADTFPILDKESEVTPE